MAIGTVGCEALDTAALWTELRAIGREYAAGAYNRDDRDDSGDRDDHRGRADHHRRLGIERAYVQGSFGGRAATPERSDVDLVVGVSPAAAAADDGFERRLDASGLRLGAAADGPRAGFDVDVVPAASALRDATKWAIHDGVGTRPYDTVYDLREGIYLNVG